MSLTPEQILALDLGLETQPEPASQVLRQPAETESEYERWLKVESQAALVIEKCGGPAAVARLIDYDPSQVFRWRYPESPHYKRGTGGLIPRRALRRLIRVARERGLLLTDEDLLPRRFPGFKGLMK